jgi:hypothetical protein
MKESLYNNLEVDKGGREDTGAGHPPGLSACGGVSLLKTTLFSRRSCKNNHRICIVIFAMRHS